MRSYGLNWCTWTWVIAVSFLCSFFATYTDWGWTLRKVGLYIVNSAMSVRVGGVIQNEYAKILKESYLIVVIIVIPTHPTVSILGPGLSHQYAPILYLSRVLSYFLLMQTFQLILRLYMTIVLQHKCWCVILFVVIEYWVHG